MTSPELRAGPARRTWLAVFIAITMALLAGGDWYYRQERDRIHQAEYQAIAAIGALKAGQIQQWRKERLADVTVVANDPFLITTAGTLSRDPALPLPLAQFQEILSIRVQAYGYSDALLLAPDGNVLIDVKKATDPVGKATQRAIAVALASRGPVLSDLYRGVDQVVYMDAVQAVREAEGTPLAVVILRSRAKSYLYPLIQAWPTPSRSAETLLVQRDGEDVLYLSPLRHRPDKALSLRLSLARQERPSVQAVLGRQHEFQGKDYRDDVEVLANPRPIPGSPWFLVTKVDVDEILAEARYRALVISLTVALLILLAAAGTAYLYRRRQARLYRILYESERRQREDQEAVRTVLYSIGDAVITTDPRCRVREMNRVAESLTGWTELEARGKPLEDVFQTINESTRAAAKSLVSSVQCDGRSVGTCNGTLLIARDGTERPIAESAAPIRGENGANCGVVLVFSDKTVEHAALKALKESEAHFRLALENSPIIIFQQDRELRYTKLFNPVPGLPISTTLGKKDEDIFVPEEAAFLTAIKRDVMVTGRSFRDSLRVTIDGKVLFFDTMVEPFRDATGRIAGITGTSMDITERMQAEIRLAESEQSYRDLFENSIAGISQALPDGHLQRVNRACALMYGYSSPEQMLAEVTDVGRQLYAYPEERTEMLRILTTEGEMKPREFLVVRRDGTRFSVLVAARQVCDSSGNLICFQNVYIDISERKRAEAELRTRQDQLHHAHQILDSHIQNSPLAVVEWDCGFRVLRWFGQAEKVFGWTESEVLGKRPEEWGFILEADAAAVAEKFKGLSDGTVPRIVSLNRNYTRSGKVIDCEWYNSSLFDENGQLVSILSLALEVTERQRVEHVLRELSGRLLHLQDEERRRIARELHDNTAQNLAAIHMNLGILERAVSPNDTRHRRLLANCENLIALSIQEIRTLSYLLHPPLLDDFGLVHAMREYAEGFSERSGIQVALDASDAQCRLPETIERALFRVLQESLGNVHRHSGSPVASVRLVRDDKQVCLEIQDEGRGLPPDLVGIGGALVGAAGVGLLGMRERMQQLGGHLELETGLPGALVRVTLPIKPPGYSDSPYKF
ncbi:sensor histidine kinase [Singulisphaera acidiphila]|uniref:histidine kinase n=1 Tax=Singulisphaera acidiphila (strain ATCC BAA-1392 / DSM 18658 / VKM B-2454 / MOB10) TaxID=886293 RepID=L0DI48_SINAD|nr:PAS domain S-box protein [Singulisphaera acidiphila]AGA29069.1 PAS domain S-box [Singulisphaera acidiphila DSM 18658]